jgi:hypothetical protein
VAAAGPLLIGDAEGRVQTIHSGKDLSELDRILLDLGHDATGSGTSLRDRVEDSDTGAGISDDKLLELAEWTYKNVEEVWSGFNLIADTSPRAPASAAPIGPSSGGRPWTCRRRCAWP